MGDITDPVVNPPTIAKPAPISPPPPPAQAPAQTRAFATCDSDDIAMRAVPGRNVQDPAYRKHGVRKANDWFPTDPKPSAGNHVIAYTYGQCAFSDMADALRTAYKAEHRIYILGWSTDKGTQLKPGSGNTLEDYLNSTRAQIRGMFYDGKLTLTPLLKVQAAGVDNTWIDQVINNLPNGGSLIDSKLPALGIHHQKLLVVQGQFGVVAFIGGMDIAPSRVNLKPPDEPWHDTQLRLVGPAALACRKVFEDRWLDHPGAGALDRKLGGTANMTADARRAFAFPAPDATDLSGLPSATLQKGSRRSVANLTVAVGRTFSNPKKFGGGGYSFAPSGDYSAWSLIESGIKQAVRWIYLEDQYLVSRMARTALLDKFKDDKFEFLLMLMNGSGAAAADFRYLITARNEFRRDLAKIDPGRKRWGMFNLKDSNDAERRKWCGTYVHSKTWIFDDGYTIIGSANCDNRGYTHDTEVVAGITDASLLDVYLGESFAVDLRTRLWHKHLGVPHSQLRDFEKGWKFWQKLPATSMVVDASAQEPDTDLSPPTPFPSAADAPGVETAWTTLIDPDSR